MSEAQNLPLTERRIDVFFAVLFVVFAITSGISDAIPTLGIEMSADSANPLARANYWYALDADPLFMHPPVWMRFVTGLSTFVYGHFTCCWPGPWSRARTGSSCPRSSTPR